MAYTLSASASDEYVLSEENKKVPFSDQKAPFLFTLTP
jgi:hypothetical protein